MSKKTLWVIVVLLLAAAAGAVYYFTSAGNSADTVTAADGSTLPADTIGPDEHVLGSPKAPVTMIEYFAQACSVCARFDQDVFPLIKAKYVDTGKVRYVMRFFPLLGPVDGAGYKLDMCMPPDKFFQSADLLFRNQSQWDSAEFQTVTDPHAGLIRMARIMGLTPEQADACMTSTKYDDAINKSAKDAETRYQPDGTPTFVIDFKKVILPSKSWQDAQAAIDAELAAKGAK